MSHTFTNLLTHIVFSTRERRPTMSAPLRSRLFPYMGGIVRDLKSKALIDHVHLVISLSPTIAISDFMSKLKGNSSKWVNENQAETFAWQTGYAAFSVSQSNMEAVEKYIAKQEEHHRKLSFKEEFLALLERHGLDHKSPYVFD
ncbi:MAG TPA: IS200/IS605 family transposase [Planctomycetota bacterium]|nr:IS200/IS605 family transposase [Planctomycetota bacterium]